MLKLLILFTMIFLHIKDDFNQKIIANLKCRDWWKDAEPDKMYRYDYIIVLLIHGFSWCFSIHLPIIIYRYFQGDLFDINPIIFLEVFMITSLMHSLVDHLKANSRKINLITDQIFHLVQIIVLWIFYIILQGGMI